MKYSQFLDIARNSPEFAPLVAYFVDYATLKDMIMTLQLSGKEVGNKGYTQVSDAEAVNIRAEFRSLLAKDVQRVNAVTIELLHRIDGDARAARLQDLSVSLPERTFRAECPLTPSTDTSGMMSEEANGVRHRQRSTELGAVVVGKADPDGTPDLEAVNVVGDDTRYKNDPLLRIYRQAYLVQHYCTLNSEGVRKICKKYDKYACDTGGKQVQAIAQLQTLPFGHQKEISQIMARLAQMYATAKNTSHEAAHSALQLEMQPVNVGTSDLESALRFARVLKDMVKNLDFLNAATVDTVVEEPSRYPWQLKVLALAILLYLFCFGLTMMGDSFKLLSSGSANAVFSKLDNPVAALMVGIFATVLVQSSSTSTSIAVSLVGSGAIGVGAGIPIIMGANIGTTVTATIVSLSHAYGNMTEFSRAFAASALHNVFNLLTVAVLFPIECVTHVLETLVNAMASGSAGGAKWEGPLKRIIKPVWTPFLKFDKTKLKESATGKTHEGSFMKSGLFKDSGMSDTVVGIIILILSLMLLCTVLLLIVKTLRSVLSKRASYWIRKGLELNPLVNMLIGVAVTVLVQSSSITTSTLVPLAAVGVVTLEQMLPVCLGANIGTTVTALLAAMASDKIEGLQLALAHLLFNIVGIILFYPFPPVRRWMIFCAEALGFMVGRWRLVAVLYIFVFFFAVPLVLLILSWIHIAVAVVFGVLMGVGIGVGMVLLYRRLKRQAAQEEREKNIEIGDAKNNMEIGDAKVEGEVEENVENVQL